MTRLLLEGGTTSKHPNLRNTEASLSEGNNTTNPTPKHITIALNSAGLSDKVAIKLEPERDEKQYPGFPPLQSYFRIRKSGQIYLIVTADLDPSSTQSDATELVLYVPPSTTDINHLNRIGAVRVEVRRWIRGDGLCDMPMMAGSVGLPEGFVASKVGIVGNHSELIVEVEIKERNLQG